MKNCALLSLFFILSKSINAQIPVYEEPRHKIVLLNPYVRLIDVNILPHDTTLYHRHSTPSVIVFLSKNITGSQVLNGETNTGQAIPGNTVFGDFANKPVSHRVWNQDTTVYHVMDIEIFIRDSAIACDTIKQSTIKFNWEQKNVRVYNIHIEPGQKGFVKASRCPHLLISISGSVNLFPADMEQKPNGQLMPGEFIWYPWGLGFEIKNDGVRDADCVLLELK
jgi:hypothetical protein